MYSFQGEIISESELCISPANRAFRYGDGVFETIRVAKGRILWSKMHFDRLQHAADILRLNTGKDFSKSSFEQSIVTLLKANHGGNANARVRFALFRNEGGLYAPITNSASFFIESEEMDSHLFELNNKGLLIDIYPEIRKPLNELSSLKSLNAQLYVLASISKREKGLGDVLIMNDSGNIAEASSSNVFLVKNGHLITPSQDQGAVDGIMRRVIIELARENDIPVLESVLTEEHVSAADEIFLTNTIQGIRWVSAFGQRRYFNSFARKLTDLLNAKAHP